MKIIEKILGLRDENARILGYKNHAEFETEIKMVKNPEIITKFLHSLTRRLKPKLKKEFAELSALKREMSNDKSGIDYYDICFADYSYYIGKLKEKKYNVSDEAVREYFPLDHVKKTILDIYSKLLSVKFKILSGYPLWHEDVELYEVRNLNGDLVSYFLLDMFRVMASMAMRLLCR